MRYWLMKSEPTTYGIDHLVQDKVTQWEGVRNYQARNFMIKEMAIGDRVLFYHSNSKPPGITGLAQVHRLAYPDYFAWDPKSQYFDPRAHPDNPIWQMVDIKIERKLKQMISLPELKDYPELAEMTVVQKGSRLSIQPVQSDDFNFILKIIQEKEY